MRTARIALSAALIAASLIRIQAASGVIDTTFGRDGTGRVLSSFLAEGAAIAIDHLDRIVVAGVQQVNGHSQVVVARYDPTGITLDLTFGNFGLAVGSIGDPDADNVAVAVAIDTANRVIVGGSTRHGDINNTDFLIGRYTAQGVLDVNFNPATPFGWRSYDIGGRDVARGMAVDSQGRIIVAGSRFGDQEQSTFCHILGLCIAGDDIVALRVLLNGDPDGSFGDGGHVAIDLHDLDEATNVTTDRQDRVVIVGANQDVDNLNIAQARVIRFNVNGSRDDSFGIRGTKSFTFNGRNYNSASAVVVDRFGRIVVGGVAADSSTSGTFFPLDHNFQSTADFALARLNDDGTFDDTFGDGGGIAPFVDIAGFDDVPRTMIVDALDHILLAGSATSPTTNTDFAIVRYNVNGTVDTHYGVNGVALTDFTRNGASGGDQVRGIGFDSRGRTIAGGVSLVAVDQPLLALARYVVEQPDFTLSTVSTLPALVAGSAAATITVNSIDGLNSPVTLRVTGADGGPVPAGFTASFDGGGAEVQVTPPPFGTATTRLDVTASAGVTPGSYQFRISSPADSPDHPHTVSFTLTVKASPAAVTDVIAALRAAGGIDNGGIANSLTAKLADAEAALYAGDTVRAANALDALINHGHAQAGKHIARMATVDGLVIDPVRVLLADARDLLGAARTANVQNPISGFVTSAVGDELRGAVLSLVDDSGVVLATATTDSDGLYVFNNNSALAAGATYSVSVTGLPRRYATASPAMQTFTWLAAPVTMAPFTAGP